VSGEEVLGLSDGAPGECATPGRAATREGRSSPTSAAWPGRPNCRTRSISGPAVSLWCGCTSTWGCGAPRSSASTSRTSPEWPAPGGRPGGHPRDRPQGGPVRPPRAAGRDGGAGWLVLCGSQPGALFHESRTRRPPPAVKRGRALLCDPYARRARRVSNSGPTACATLRSPSCGWRPTGGCRCRRSSRRPSRPAVRPGQGPGFGQPTTSPGPSQFPSNGARVNRQDSTWSWPNKRRFPLQSFPCQRPHRKPTP
jgi:hypothetical protein